MSRKAREDDAGAPTGPGGHPFADGARPAGCCPWEVLEQEQVHRNPLFTIRRERCRSARTRRERDFFVLETCDWVNVIPLTDGGEVILIEQFRHGSRGISLEIPGGMVDPTDASALDAAKRELREETGCGARDWQELGAVLPNPAIQGNRCTTFLAAGAHPLGPPDLDPWEEIRVVPVPLARIPELIRRGAIDHSLVIAAFHWLELWERGGGMG